MTTTLKAWLPPPSAPPPSQPPQLPAGVPAVQPFGNDPLQQKPSLWAAPAPLLNVWSNPLQPGPAAPPQPLGLQTVQPPAWGTAPSLRPLQEPPVIPQQQHEEAAGAASRQAQDQTQKTGLSNMAGPLQQLFVAAQRAGAQQDQTHQLLLPIAPPAIEVLSASPVPPHSRGAPADRPEASAQADRQEHKAAPWAAVATKGEQCPCMTLGGCPMWAQTLHCRSISLSGGR